MKAFELKGPELIKPRLEQDFKARVTQVLSHVRGVTKRDVLTLMTEFGCLAEVIKADQEALAKCPGFGPVKVSWRVVVRV